VAFYSWTFPEFMHIPYIRRLWMLYSRWSDRCYWDRVEFMSFLYCVKLGFVSYWLFLRSFSSVSWRYVVHVLSHVSCHINNWPCLARALTTYGYRIAGQGTNYLPRP
jgi:hypothetical protein